jgi:hypothetical protein
LWKTSQELIAQSSNEWIKSQDESGFVSERVASPSKKMTTVGERTSGWYCEACAARPYLSPKYDYMCMCSPERIKLGLRGFGPKLNYWEDELCNLCAREEDVCPGCAQPKTESNDEDDVEIGDVQAKINANLSCLRTCLVLFEADYNAP